MHDTHIISLHTVQAMFGHIEYFWSAWTPIYFRPGTLYKALEDHAIHKAFLESSSTLQADPVKYTRVDFNGNSGIKQTSFENFTERSRIWKFDGGINYVLQPIDEHAMFHDYLRICIVSRNLVWE
jgi:hypothetical protein